jgi:hypothetical protein
MAAGEAPVPTASPTEPPPAVAMRQLLLGVFVSQAISVFAKLGVANTLATGPRAPMRSPTW